MRFSSGLAIAAAALCFATARGFAEDTPTFVPEVLLMKTAQRGTEKSFSYAKLKPAVTQGKDLTAVFRYRADVDTVTVTIKAQKPDAHGIVSANVTTERQRTLPDGHDDTTRKTGTYKFTKGKSLIVDNQPRMLANDIDANVEVLQLTMEQ
jgi:hypothetical protein